MIQESHQMGPFLNIWVKRGGTGHPSQLKKECPLFIKLDIMDKRC